MVAILLFFFFFFNSTLITFSSLSFLLTFFFHFHFSFIPLLGCIVWGSHWSAFTFVIAGGYLTGGLQDANFPYRTEPLKMSKVCLHPLALGLVLIAFFNDGNPLRLDGDWRKTIRTSGKNLFPFSY